MSSYIFIGLIKLILSNYQITAHVCGIFCDKIVKCFLNAVLNLQWSMVGDGARERGFW